MADKKVPGLRFKGFVDDWAQHELGDYIRDSGNRTSDFEKYPLYSLTIENGVTPKTQRYERGFLVTKEEDLFKIVEPGNFVTNPMNLRFGAVGYNGETFPVSVSGYYDVFEIDRNLCGGFWNSYFRSTIGLRKFDDAATGSLIEKRRVHYSELKKIEFWLPQSIDERKAIGTFMEYVEDLIALHQRKHDKLLAIKKAMLEKMFPKAGSDVPEIRFSGFTGAWERRSLGDVFTEYSEKNHADLPALTIVQGGGTVRRDESDRSLQYDKASLSNYKLVNEGDFIVHLRSFEGGLEVATTTGIISPAYHTFHGDNTDSRFYYPYFRSQKFIESDLKPHVYGIRDGRSIDIEGMKTIEIPYTSPEEQRVIGRYIEHLDNLITLHQRKYEKLRQLKQSLLEKMFV